MNNISLMTLGGLPAPIFAERVEEVKDILRLHPTCEETTKKLQTDYVKHHFEDGVYGRELFMPEGTVVISRVHKAGSVNVISKGSVIIIDTDGCRELHAPCTFTSPIGTQRIVRALQDTVWTGVHHTDCTDPEGLFEDLTCDSYDEFTKYLEDKTCGQQ